jgi:hypothetical protein
VWCSFLEAQIETRNTHHDHLSGNAAALSLLAELWAGGLVLEQVAQSLLQSFLASGMQAPPAY